MKWLWNASHYWPAWLLLATGTLLVREVWALVTHRAQDTLSDWVWHVLQITKHEPMALWNATDFIVFGCWLTLVTWLTYHFFFHLYG